MFRNNIVRYSAAHVTGSIKKKTLAHFEDDLVGPLLPRVNEKDWLIEETRMENLVAERFTDSSCKGSYYPASVIDWKRTFDRDAGDDDEDIRVKYSRVPDTGLYKVKLLEEYVAIKTASAEKLIEIINVSRVDDGVLFWRDILYRLEYISSTLSVKKIRLLLSAMSVSPNREYIDSNELVRIVHLLGQEMLCRYHSLTLFSCSCIAHSLSLLNCKDPGTLNILVICFKQILHETNHSVSNEQIIQFADTVKSAFTTLQYHVDVLDEIMVKVDELRRKIESNKQTLHSNQIS